MPRVRSQTQYLAVTFLSGDRSKTCDGLPGKRHWLTAFENLITWEVITPLLHNDRSKEAKPHDFPFQRPQEGNLPEVWVWLSERD